MKSFSMVKIKKRGRGTNYRDNSYALERILINQSNINIYGINKWKEMYPRCIDVDKKNKNYIYEYTNTIWEHEYKEV